MGGPVLASTVHLSMKKLVKPYHSMITTLTTQWCQTALPNSPTFHLPFHTLRSKNGLKVFYFQKENPSVVKILMYLHWINLLIFIWIPYSGTIIEELLKRELQNTNEAVRKDNEYQSILWYQNDARSYHLKHELLTWLHLSFTRNKCISGSH